MTPSLASYALAFALCLAPRLARSAEEGKPDPPKIDLNDEERAILVQTNEERTRAGLKPLVPSAVLCKVARGHCENMAKQNKVDHVLDGKTPFKRVDDAGYKCLLWGENVGFGLEGWTPLKMMQWWMGSEVHRNNILHKDFVEIGVGFVRDPKGKSYYTQVFAVPKR
jgi:uncharacterized protein YkwD